MYIHLRTKDGFQTRNPKKRPKHFEAFLEKKDGSRERIKIDASKYPTIYPVLHLPPPGILSGEKLSEMSPEGMELSIMENPEEIKALAAEYPDAKITLQSGFKWSDFFWVLAKIAHGLTIGHCGDVGYTPLLPPIILGTCSHLSHFIGGKIEVTDPRIMKIGDGYEVILDSDRKLIITNVQILNGRCQTYTVVSGYITDWQLFMTNISHIKLEGKREFAHGMRTRFMFIHEWVMWIIKIIRHFVERDYPNLVARWPLLAGYTFKVYAIPPNHYLLILKNAPQEIPSGPDAAITLPHNHNDHPRLPTSREDIVIWEQWCRTRFSLSSDQWPILLPAYDSGKSHNVDGDFKMFSEDEKRIWVDQMNHLIHSQLIETLKAFSNKVKSR